MQISTIGLDLAKHIFQVHGIDANKKVVVRKQLRRSQVMAFFEALPPCLVGMEACATAHHWSRELRKLGHDVRLMPARDGRLTLSATRTMPLMPRRSARQCGSRPCDLLRSRRLSSRDD